MNLTLVQAHRIFKSIMKYSDNPIVQKILNESLNDDNNMLDPGEVQTRTAIIPTENQSSDII